MSRTFFAYHIEHFFGKFNLGDYYSNSLNATEGDTIYVVSGYKKSGKNQVDYKLEGVFKIAKRIEGKYILEKTTGGTGEFKFKLIFTPIRVPPKAIELERSDWYSAKEFHNYFSSGQNFNPLPTKPDYKARFDLLLAEFSDNSDKELIEDLEDIYKSQSNDTVKEVLAKARVGQGKFRKDTIKEWGIGEKCAVTEIDIPELLIASHIKPWRASNDTERLDPANGIILVTHIDKLFDNYLVSFKKNKSRFEMVANPIVEPTLKKMGVNLNAQLKSESLGFSLTNRLEAYLLEHYSKFEEMLTKFKPK